MYFRFLHFCRQLTNTAVFIVSVLICCFDWNTLVSPSGLRTSPGPTGCWGTGGSAQSEWAKKKTSTRRTPLPTRPPGALYSLPTTASLSDPQTRAPQRQYITAAWISVMSNVGARLYRNLNTAPAWIFSLLSSAHASSLIVDFCTFFI